MRWGLDLLLSLVGLILGFATVSGWIVGWEGMGVGLLIGVVIALILGQYVGGKYFMNGFIVGIVSSLLSSLLVYAQFDTYFTHYSQSDAYKQAMDKMAQAGKSMSADEMKSMSQNWMLIFAPVGALIAGAIQGLLTLAAGKIFGKKPATAAVSVESMPTDDINNPPA
jgi:hypothetical protein